MSESTIQSDIKAALMRLGYEVKSTSSYRRLRRGAIEKGIPDLLVTRHDWPIGAWLGMEVKKPTGKASEEQRELLGKGRIVVVTSVDEAYDAARGFQGAA